MNARLCILSIVYLTGCASADTELLGEWTINPEESVLLAKPDNAFALKAELPQLANGLTVRFEKKGIVRVKANERDEVSRFTIVESGEDARLLQIESPRRNHRVLAVIQGSRMVLSEQGVNLVLVRN